MATVMKTSRDVRGIGLRIPRAGRAGEGRRQDPVRRRTSSLPGMLQARLLRSPHAHARIKRIDVSKAKALPGVRAILTAARHPGASITAPRPAATRSWRSTGRSSPGSRSRPSRPTSWRSRTRRST